MFSSYISYNVGESDNQVGEQRIVKLQSLEYQKHVNRDWFELIFESLENSYDSPRKKYSGIF